MKALSLSVKDVPEKDFLAQAVLSMLKQVEKTKSEKTESDWTPQQKKYINDLHGAGKNIILKMKNLGFNMELGYHPEPGKVSKLKK